jgi:hypothetical protein
MEVTGLRRRGHGVDAGQVVQQAGGHQEFQPLGIAESPGFPGRRGTDQVQGIAREGVMAHGIGHLLPLRAGQVACRHRLGIGEDRPWHAGPHGACRQLGQQREVLGRHRLATAAVGIGFHHQLGHHLRKDAAVAVEFEVGAPAGIRGAQAQPLHRLPGGLRIVAGLGALDVRAIALGADGRR